MGGVAPRRVTTSVGVAGRPNLVRTATGVVAIEAEAPVSRATAPRRHGVQGSSARADAPRRALRAGLVGPDRAAPGARNGAAVRTGRAVPVEVGPPPVPGEVPPPKGTAYGVGGRTPKVAASTAPRRARGPALCHLVGAGQEATQVLRPHGVVCAAFGPITHEVAAGQAAAGGGPAAHAGHDALLRADEAPDDGGKGARGAAPGE